MTRKLLSAKPLGDRSMAYEESLEKPFNHPRCLQVRSVTGAANNRQPAVVTPNRRAHSLGDRAIGGVALPHHQHYRHPQLPQPSPQRGHGAGAGKPQARGKPRGRIGQALGRCLGRDAGEHRLREPVLDESRNPDALDLCRAPLVESAAQRSLVVVCYARRRADQHEGAYAIGPVKREPQANSSAEGIPRVHGVASGVGHEPRTLREACAHRGGFSVTGKVYADDPPVRREKGGYAIPGSMRLGEAVHQDHRRSAPLDDRLQSHAPSMA